MQETGVHYFAFVYVVVFCTLMHLGIPKRDLYVCGMAILSVLLSGKQRESLPGRGRGSS